MMWDAKRVFDIVSTMLYDNHKERLDPRAPLAKQEVMTDETTRFSQTFRRCGPDGDGCGLRRVSGGMRFLCAGQLCRFQCGGFQRRGDGPHPCGLLFRHRPHRSEEHTSELQS